MALAAGRLILTLEYGKDLKDRDWGSRMDPYAVITCGNQRQRSRTCHGAGRNPVWSQKFMFQVMNENSVTIELWDHDDLSRDDEIGWASISLAQVRMTRMDHVTAPVMSRRTHRQRGLVVVSLSFEPNSMPYAAYPVAQQQPWYPPAPSYQSPPPAYVPPAPPTAAYGPPPPAPYQPQPNTGYLPMPSAPPPPTVGYQYPQMPAQQYYPGPAPAAVGGPPPPMRFW